MQNLMIWNIDTDKPQRLERSFIKLEGNLENWIEHDPSLLQPDLEIVGRQLQLDAGRLDLLAIDSVGRWVIIEIKRGKLHRETIAQALDYAASISEMSFEMLTKKVNTYLKPLGKSLEELLEIRGAESSPPTLKNIIIFVAGTEREDGLERMARFLKGGGYHINAVTFEVFENANGSRLILRELTELDTTPQKEVLSVKQEAITHENELKEANSVEALCALAAKNGLGKEFQYLLDAAQSYNLYPRTYKHSIMFTPPKNRTRMLFTVWAKPSKTKRLQVYVGPSAFTEFYPINRIDAWRFLGSDGYREMDMEQVRKFVQNLDMVFNKIARNS